MKPEDKECLDHLIPAITLPKIELALAADIGRLLFEMETQEGLPVEIALDEIKKRDFYKELPKALWVYAIFKYQNLLVEHKLKSGMPFDGKQHLKLKELNKKKFINFIKTGEYESL